MGFDFGLRRIGIAVGQASPLSASPLARDRNKTSVDPRLPAPRTTAPAATSTRWLAPPVRVTPCTTQPSPRLSTCSTSTPA